MVLGEAAASAAAGASALWNYNRENYLFDRKMRQLTEYQILEWRNVQSELWRDDVRDIIGLTERKMDSYLIVNTLQLSMCLGLFAEGRLEPGTPPWLLHFYMLTLGAAFMYLLMSVWLAMHASIVASCSSVRILTQFVRLPVPTWQQLEEMRTYAQSYESVEPGHMLRFPFTRSLHGLWRKGVAAEDQPRTRGAPDIEAAGQRVDPWGLESHGQDRDLYELQEKPVSARRHVALARRAAKQYQCYDAFARVSMSFGTNQLVNAILYYCLGYVAVQDGAPWPAWCIVAIMCAIAVALVMLDFSLNRKEQLLAQVLILTGPVCAACATCLWTAWGERANGLMMVFLPMAYAAHGLWLLFALTACDLELQPNGSVLPLKFRAVLYLDVFGWLTRGGAPEETSPRNKRVQGSLYTELPQHRDADTFEAQPDGPNAETTKPWLRKFEASEPSLPVESSNQALSSEKVAAAANDLLEQTLEAAKLAVTPVVKAFDAMDPEEEPESPPGGRSPQAPGQVWLPGFNPSGELPHAPSMFFHPASYSPAEPLSRSQQSGEIVTGQEAMHPGRIPAKVFRLATLLLIGLWALGLALPLGVFREFMTRPLTANILVEELPKQGGEAPIARQVTAAVGSGPDGLPELIPEFVGKGDLPALPESELLSVDWPRHSGFVPRSLSCDPTGTHLVVADDLGLYEGFLLQGGSSPTPRALEAPSATGLPASPTPLVNFTRVPPCPALEGQALKDIGVVCSSGSLAEADSCRVVVLHAHGKQLSECPLQRGTTRSKPDEKLLDYEGKSLQDRETWLISGDWLNMNGQTTPEYVDSVAVSSDCLNMKLHPLDRGDARDAGSVGCVVVGTTSGRIVQLRSAFADSRRLVPERAIEQRPSPVGRGSLHVLRNGVVMALRHDSNTVQALDSKQGTVIGEWRLPKDIRWLTICGGGDNLFLLGLRSPAKVELYTFPLPAELKGTATTPALLSRVWRLRLPLDGRFPEF